MLLAAMLAMMLVAAAPAFAQATGTATGGGATAGPGAAVATCQNVAAQVINNQPRVTQNINADADARAAATGFVVDIDAGRSAPNALRNADIDVDDVIGVADADTAVNAMINAGVDARLAQECATTLMTGGATTTAGAAGGGGGGGGGGAAGGGGQARLPATGGASLFALGAGALLVAGGLVARRMIR